MSNDEKIYGYEKDETYHILIFFDKDDGGIELHKNTQHAVRRSDVVEYLREKTSDLLNRLSFYKELDEKGFVYLWEIDNGMIISERKYNELFGKEVSWYSATSEYVRWSPEDSDDY